MTSSDALLAVPQRRTAAGAVAAGLLGLGTLALLLPRPFPLTWSTATASGAPTEQALLSAAGFTVWVLLGWHLLILATALLGRLPGRTGRGCRRLLRRLAPWTSSRVVAAAVGLTLLSGTGACASGLAAGDGDGAGPVTGSGSSSTADTGSPEDPSTGTDSGRVITSMSIDWPDTSPADAAPAVTSPAVTSPAVTSPAVTSPAVTSPAVTSPADPAPARAPTTGKPASSPAAGTPTPAAPAPAAVSPSRGADVTHATAPAGTGPVAVRAGDSLWSIAHRFLPANATDADTDIAWHAWYVANQATIGDDPNLIQPGQLLLPPTSRTG